MSVHVTKRRLAPADITALKGQRPIVSLTAYTTPIAKLMDPHVDFMLVGDSLGMVLYGLDSTVGVTLEMMIAHGQAVMRGSSNACVVVDLPFGSYQESKELAFRSAARVLKETGCSAIKLEGGAEMAETVAFLTQRGIPVLGHVGLMPQLINTTGGYRSLGRSDKEAEKIRRDAKAIDDAGAFAIVIEGTVEPVAREISALIKVPTIGIGASPACDGQVLVVDDALGVFTDFKPRFVKHFANLAPLMSEAFAAYAEEVKARTFPGQEHTFQVKSKTA
ncbi:3-methyl-2-oxobutanoate hydroxymethyltransferase [Mycoplana ramosa]|uniref:3-methyl-2-oxobutanoate hydroxymethyltransferase n=1 Tax=Mycoplana ramosa TaxID=40837 RepID=A0ABW3YX99_MYCRA